jgi:Sec7-like guanine-nucleotide exchange factor
MLNTDAHNPQVKNKMTKEQFLRNNAGINNGKDLPKELLESLYTRIVTNEIKMTTQGSIFTAAERKGWCRKQGGRVKTWKKRYMVLKDNCLYYFKKETVRK